MRRDIMECSPQALGLQNIPSLAVKAFCLLGGVDNLLNLI